LSWTLVGEKYLAASRPLSLDSIEPRRPPATQRAERRQIGTVSRGAICARTWPSRPAPPHRGGASASCWPRRRAPAR